jgi:hypothetical protein
MSASNISKVITIDFNDYTDAFVIALGNAYAVEIDEWAKTQNTDSNVYQAVMVELQSNFVRVCDYLDAKHPVATGWGRNAPQVTQPQFWDHSLDTEVALETAPDGEIPLRNA